MAKILIPKNNTPWGVMKYTAAPDAYEHVLSFDTPELKTKFVGKYLFDNEDFDYLAAMDEVNYFKSFTRTNELRATLNVGLDELNQTIQGVELTYTLDDLLSIDSIFVRENGITRLYSVDSAERTTQQNQTMIRYELSQDVFFNHYDDLEFEGTVHWERAHTNRHNGFKFLKEDNRNRESIIDNWVPDVIEAEEIIKTDSLPADQSELLSKITFAIVHVSLADSVNSGKGDGTEVFYQRQDNGSFSYYVDHIPENIFVFPINLTESYSTELWDSNVFAPAFYLVDKNGRSKSWGRKAYNAFKNDTNLISIEYVNGAALPIEYGMFTQIEVDTATTSATSPLIRFYFGGEFDTNASDSSLNGLKATWKHANWYEGCNAMRIASIRGKTQFGQSLKIEVPKPELTTYNELRNIKNEAKLQLEVKDYSIQGKNGEPFNFKPSILNKSLDTIEDFRVKYSFQLNPFQSYGWYGFDDSEQFNTSSAINYKFGYKEKSKKLPTTSEEWAEYVSQNAYERSVGGTVIDLGGNALKQAVAGAAGGFFIGGPLGSAIGGGIGAASGLLTSWTKRASNKINLKNTPDKYNGVFDNFVEDAVAENTAVKIVKRGFIKEEEQLLFDMFTEIGYEVNRQGKFEDYSNNRYYYNFIKTDSVFSNIQNRLSSNIKQVISDTFTKGFTVWHVRDLETFKGIVNYDYENQEMNLIDLKAE